MGLLDSTLKWFGYEKSLTFKRPDGWFPGWELNIGDISVDDQSSLKSSAYYATIVVACNTVSILPKHVRRRTTSGHEIDRSHDQFRLINKRSNPYQSSAVFFKEFAFNRKHRGNGLAWLEGVDSRRGRPMAYWNLNPRFAELDFQSGDAFIRYDRKLPDGRELKEWRPYREFLHVPNDVGVTGEVGAIWGQPTINFADQAIKLDLIAERSGSTYLSNNGIVKDYFKYPKPLGKPQREILANSLKEYGPGGKREGQRPLLEDNMSIEGLNINLGDIDLDRLRYLSLESQARFNTFPALFKIGHHERSNFANAYQATVEFVTTTMLPTTQPMQEELDYKTMLPSQEDTHFVNFEYKTLLQAEPDKQAEFLRAVFNVGGVTSNKIAEIFDMPSMGEEGNKGYVMSNMIPTAMVDEYWRTLIMKAGQMAPAQAKEILDEAIKSTNGVH